MAEPPYLKAAGPGGAKLQRGWRPPGSRQTVVVVSRVIFDAHAWMAGNLSCVQARSTATKWRRPAWLAFSSSIICENLEGSPQRSRWGWSAGTCARSKAQRRASAPEWGWELRQGFNVGKREALNQRAVLATADAMSSVAALSFGVSASVMRPTSPYLKAPPLAHSTTSPMPCFLVVATRRAAVRNSFRS